jgi:hypothetical protein
MKKFIVEHTIPSSEHLTPGELKAIVEKSNSVIHNMNEPIHWIQTFVTGKKLYCIHIASDQSVVLAHAARCGFPVTHMEEVTTIIDSATSD